MACITAKPILNIDVHFVISEGEARALDAMAGYGDDAFVAAFYEKLGEAYMRNHERGLREFLNSIRAQMPVVLSKIDAARKAYQ